MTISAYKRLGWKSWESFFQVISWFCQNTSRNTPLLVYHPNPSCTVSHLWQCNSVLSDGSPASHIHLSILQWLYILLRIKAYKSFPKPMRPCIIWSLLPMRSFITSPFKKHQCYLVQTHHTLWPKGLDIYCFLPGIYFLHPIFICLPSSFLYSKPILLYSSSFFPRLSYFLLFSSIFLWGSTFL